MDSTCYSFVVEWFDPQTDLIKTFLMNYYTDGSVELVDKKTNKMFLKRIEVDISDKLLYIGAIITVFARQLNIIDYGNEFTKKQFEARGGKGTLLVTPNGYAHIGKIISSLERSKLSLGNVKMIRVKPNHIKSIRDLVDDSSTQNLSDAIELLTKDVSVAIEIIFTSPDDFPSWKSSADGLTFKKYVLYSNSPDSVEYFFGGNFPSTAHFENCTLCIIRPRVLKEGNAGKVIDEILKGQFEISALELFRLTSAVADEFFGVYKGVMKNYSDMLQCMISGPCMVLEVRGPKIVDSFRDFCGPFDIEIAQILQPESLRGRYGHSAVENGIHCTDCPEDGVLESQYFFRMLQV